jgi:UDP-4-amino-4,6-dideoxy-N-acetyl-beta-L-altrosamine transaminase
MIPYGRQEISESDIQAVVDVLRSDFLTQGPAVPAFENAVATYCSARHAVAVNSASSALHLACLALGVGPGDWVWTSPITFVASANAALHCGARVDFVDIDPSTGNMSVARLTEKLAQAKRAGCLPKTLIPVHLCGQPCEMEAIHALGQQYGFTIIEDAAHAIGGRYKGERIGNGRYSDITVFSFHPVKIVTTAEGGMALTNDARLARKLQRLRSHGITRDAAEMTHPPDGPWYYQQIELGFNFRMTDLQAALGLSQMQRIDSFLGARRSLAARYDEKLIGLPLVTPRQHADGCSAWHLYVVRLQTTTAGKSRREVFDALRAADIGVNVHYIPVPSQPYFERMGFHAASWPEAQRYYDEAISLPLFATLTGNQQDSVIAALRSALG